MEHATYFTRVSDQTPTQFWINNVTREEADAAIGHGATGCTQNPSYTWKILSGKGDKEHADALLDGILTLTADDNEALVTLQRQLVGGIAEIFMPIYRQSGGKKGFVSIQGDPFHEDADTMVKHARFNREAGPNIMAKIPVTAEGLEAIEILAAEGIPINATEVMSVRQAMDVCEAYMKATRGMKAPAPIYYSHIAGIFDEYLADAAKKAGSSIPSDYLWQAGIAVSKKIYEMAGERGYPVGFIGGGARGLHHFTEMVGADACITINWEGYANTLIRQDPPVVQRFLQPTPHSVIDSLCTLLPDFRKAYFLHEITPEEYEEFGPVVHFRRSFEDSWNKALQYISQRRRTMPKG